MYFRYGFTSTCKSVTLTTSWKKYSLEMPKNPYLSSVIYTYVDKAGTFWLNNLTLCDGSNGKNNYNYENGYSYTTQSYTHGSTYGTLPAPTRDGYTFLGWFTQAEGGTQITTSTKVSDFNMRVYAHWDKNITDNVSKVVYDGKKKYELYEDSVTWEQAKQLCEEKGGHLVTINSEEENDLVYEMINDSTHFTWLGGKRNETGEEWEWVTGESFDYTHWYSSEPNNTDEYYIQMYPMNTNGTQGSYWNDCGIETTYHSYYSYRNSVYICEYEAPLIGDVNLDEVVDINDVTEMQRYIAKLIEFDDEQITLADANRDGEIDIIDATAIQKYLAGIISEL